MTKAFLIEQFCRFEGPIRQLVDLLPEDRLDWQPTGNTMPARVLIQHLGDAAETFARSFRDFDLKFKPPDFEGPRGKSKRDLLSAVEKQFADARQMLESIPESDFDSRRIRFDPGGTPIEGTVAELLTSLGFVHQAYTTMQLFWYVRQLGIDADSGTLYFGLPPGQFSTRAPVAEAAAR